MKLRDYAAITTGTLTFIAAAAAQWIWTKRPIQDVLFIALMFSFIGFGAFAIATEPKRPQPRRHRARTVRYEDWRPYFITLDKEQWNNGKERT